MENFIYENQGANTYLVYKVPAEQQIDNMTLGMITNNEIIGFADTIFTQLNMEKLIKYDVTALVSMKQFFDAPINKKRILTLFSNIAEGFSQAEEYMIDFSSILLDMSWIFVSVSDLKVKLICLPVQGEHSNITVRDFFRNIVMNTQFDQTENCDYVAALMNYLNSNSTVLIDNFRDFLRQLNTNNAERSVTSNSVAESAKQVKTASKPQPAPSREEAVVSQPKPVAITPPPAPKAIAKPAVTPTPTDKPTPTPAAKAASVPQNTGFAIPGHGGNGSFEIPGGGSIPAPKQVNKNVANSTNSGEKMSLLYLLQHYSKDNKALYDAQKEAKKAEKAAAIPTPQPKASKSEPTPQADFTPQVQPQNVQVVQDYTSATNAMKLNFGETVYMSSEPSEGTVMLSEDALAGYASKTASLVRVSNNERVVINKAVFKLGREASFVDYVVNNPVVGRSHANIISKNDEWFIVDQNSKNHTYVNGIMVTSQVETAIQDGDHIKLGNEEFTFEFR